MLLMKRHLLILCIVPLLIGAGCSSSVIPQQRAVDIISSAKKTVQGENRPFEWKSLQNGIDRGESVTMRDGWKERLVVFRFDPNFVNFRLVNLDQLKTIRAWRDELPSALFIMNGVYFHTDGTPVGSLRIDGKEWSKTEFDADRSGVFEFDSVPSIIDTEKDSKLVRASKTSAQSYPFLIKDGIASVSVDSHLLARRSFIGIDQDEKVYLGVFPDGEISLFEFSKLLKELPIQWKDVLNLDGGPSTSYFSRISGSDEIEDGYSAVPNVIAVEGKN